MSTDIDEGSGYLIFRGKPEPGQLVGGFVLSAIGVSLAVQVVRAIRASRAATHAGWTEYLPGVLFWGAISLAFLLPGMLMLLYRRSVRVDVAAGQVTEWRKCLGVGLTRVYSLSSFKKIVVARREIKRRRAGQGVGSDHAKRTYPYFVVELASSAGKPMRLVADAKPEPARDAASRLAAAAHLAVSDQIPR